MIFLFLSFFLSPLNKAWTFNLDIQVEKILKIENLEELKDFAYRFKKKNLLFQSCQWEVKEIRFPFSCFEWLSFEKDNIKEEEYQNYRNKFDLICQKANVFSQAPSLFSKSILFLSSTCRSLYERVKEEYFYAFPGAL